MRRKFRVQRKCLCQNVFGLIFLSFLLFFFLFGHVASLRLCTWVDGFIRSSIKLYVSVNIQMFMSTVHIRTYESSIHCHFWPSWHRAISVRSSINIMRMEYHPLKPRAICKINERQNITILKLFLSIFFLLMVLFHIVLLLFHTNRRVQPQFIFHLVCDERLTFIS